MLNTEFEFNLLTPFDYHHQGEAARAESLKLKAPTSKLIKYIAPIKQAVSASALAASSFFIKNLAAEELAKLANMQTEQKSNSPVAADSKEKQVEDILNQLHGCLEINMDSVFQAFFKLLVEGGGHINDTAHTPLTVDLLNKLSYEDVERLLGEYIVSFLK